MTIMQKLATPIDERLKERSFCLVLRLISSVAGQARRLRVQNKRSKSKPSPNRMGGAFLFWVWMTASGRFSDSWRR
jgi:hypothetical protein